MPGEAGLASVIRGLKRLAGGGVEGTVQHTPENLPRRDGRVGGVGEGDSTRMLARRVFDSCLAEIPLFLSV
jgi:hypothetical protein